MEAQTRAKDSFILVWFRRWVFNRIRVNCFTALDLKTQLTLMLKREKQFGFKIEFLVEEVVQVVRMFMFLRIFKIIIIIIIIVMTVIVIKKIMVTEIQKNLKRLRFKKLFRKVEDISIWLR